jgi:AcrR family transcriptional regulator
MRRLATDVGLSKSALFHYFSTKHELYEEVLDRVLERLESALETGRKPLGGPVERLEGWIDSLHLALAEDIPSARLLMRMMLEEEPFSGFLLEPRAGRPMRASEMRLARILGRLGALLEEGVATGVFRPLSIGDAVRTTIGASVFHFASGDLGQALLGESSFAAAAAERRRSEISDFIRRGLLA